MKTHRIALVKRMSWFGAGWEGRASLWRPAAWQLIGRSRGGGGAWTFGHFYWRRAEWEESATTGSETQRERMRDGAKTKQMPDFGGKTLHYLGGREGMEASGALETSTAT